MPGKIPKFCALLLTLALAVKPGISSSTESRNFPLDLDPDSHPITPATLENLRRERAGREPVHDPAALELPPFLPDTEPVRAEYAQMLDNSNPSAAVLWVSADACP